MSVEHASSSHGKEQEAPVAQLKPGAVLHAHGDVPRIRHERLQVGVTRLPQGHSLLLRSQQPLARVPRARPDTHSGAVPMRSPLLDRISGFLASAGSASAELKPLHAPFSHDTGGTTSLGPEGGESSIPPHVEMRLAIADLNDLRVPVSGSGARLGTVRHGHPLAQAAAAAGAAAASCVEVVVTDSEEEEESSSSGEDEHGGDSSRSSSSTSTCTSSTTSSGKNGAKVPADSLPAAVAGSTSRNHVHGHADLQHNHDGGSGGGGEEGVVEIHVGDPRAAKLSVTDPAFLAVSTILSPVHAPNPTRPATVMGDATATADAQDGVGACGSAPRSGIQRPLIQECDSSGESEEAE